MNTLLASRELAYYGMLKGTFAARGGRNRQLMRRVVTVVGATLPITSGCVLCPTLPDLAAARARMAANKKPRRLGGADSHEISRELMKTNYGA
jgi:hypothetical protein